MNIWTRPVAGALPWLAVAIVSSGLVLVSMMPAAWITPQFAKATQGHVNLVDASGSLWHGSATVMLSAGDDVETATVLPGRVEWSTSFWSIFAGRLHMDLRETDEMPEPLRIDASLSGATVSANGIAVPATLFRGLGAPFNTLNLQGNVYAKWTTLRLIHGRAFGGITVTFDDVASSVSPVRPLGSYRVEVQEEGAAATLDLATLKGPLLLTGRGRVGAGGTSFNGAASAVPEQRDNLAGLLNLLGRPTATGSTALSYGR
jgi:general secretion pathway protein N